MRRVVVTGIGIVSCIGNDQKTVVDSLKNLKSGITKAEEYEEYGLRSLVHGKPKINLDELIDRKICKDSKNEIIKILNQWIEKKEIDIILFLNDYKKPQKVNVLQNKVWGYSLELETHTVETHIYRLRKKIFEKFRDNNFINSTKKGYII